MAGPDIGLAHVSSELSHIKSHRRQSDEIAILSRLLLPQMPISVQEKPASDVAEKLQTESEFELSPKTTEYTRSRDLYLSANQASL